MSTQNVVYITGMDMKRWIKYTIVGFILSLLHKLWDFYSVTPCLCLKSKDSPNTRTASKFNRK